MNNENKYPQADEEPFDTALRMFGVYWDKVEAEMHRISTEKGWHGIFDPAKLSEAALKLRALSNEMGRPESDRKLSPSNFKTTCREVIRHLVDISGEKSDRDYIALIHSEASEALEGCRAPEGSPAQWSQKIPEYLAAEEELADVVIRVMDYARDRGFRVVGAMIAKIAYNRNRTTRHGGKKF